jgi:acyl-CoA reductase-like NAD-dependent aldehyde dehydrogenase
MDFERIDPMTNKPASKAQAMTAKEAAAVADRAAAGLHHVNSLIDDATAKGASIVAGGKADSVLMPATVVDGVTSRMNIYRDESFGPVVGIIHAKDEADAIRLANDSAYGLSAAVFTRDTARGLRVARQIRSGICHVNGPTVHDEPQMPFGGVGASGYGRFGGKAGIDQFTELRWITVETQPGHFPI